MKIKSIEEYEQLKKEYLKIEKEQTLLAEKLILWERTRPENILFMENSLQKGYKINHENGEIYSEEKDKQFLLNLGKVMKINQN